MPRVRHRDLSAEEWADIDQQETERKDREDTIRTYYWMFFGNREYAERHLREIGLLP
jgi:hypothetical protein